MHKNGRRPPDTQRFNTPKNGSQTACHLERTVSQDGLQAVLDAIAHATNNNKHGQAAESAPQRAALLDSIPTSDFERQFEYYLSLYCYDHSETTKNGKRDILRLLMWFLRDRGFEQCDQVSITAFLEHCIKGHTEPGGRWGKGHEHPRYYKPTRPRTAQLYYTYLNSFFNAMVEKGHLDVSPMQKVKRPRVEEEDIQPFSQQQVLALIEAASRSEHPLRNISIITLMFDTGLRAGEVCALTHADLNLQSHYLLVQQGKGNKKRVVHFRNAAAEALMAYLREDRLRGYLPAPEEPLFPRDKRGRGKPLAVEGLRQLYKRLGKAAGISGVRCSPHTMRHSFATSFMMNGASQKAVMKQLGHRNPKMTLRYQSITDAQLAEQHNECSPADNLKGKRSK